MSKPRKVLNRRTNLPKNRKYGCNNAGEPIINPSSVGVRRDNDGNVFADFDPIDPDVQAELDRVLKGVPVPVCTGSK